MSGGVRYARCPVCSFQGHWPERVLDMLGVRKPMLMTCSSCGSTLVWSARERMGGRLAICLIILAIVAEGQGPQWLTTAVVLAGVAVLLGIASRVTGGLKLAADEDGIDVTKRTESSNDADQQGH